MWKGNKTRESVRWCLDCRVSQKPLSLSACSINENHQLETWEKKEKKIKEKYENMSREAKEKKVVDGKNNAGILNKAVRC